MAQSLRVSATQFSRSFAKYQDEAHTAELIEVTSHGRVIGGYLGAKELEHYYRMKKKEREVLLVDELDAETLAELKAAQYGVISE